MISELKNLTAIRIGRLEEMWFRIDSPRLDTLEGVKPINMFIGANNAGKSRLFRAIFSHPIEQYDTDPTLIESACKAVTDYLETSQCDNARALLELFDEDSKNRLYTSNLATTIQSTLHHSIEDSAETWDLTKINQAAQEIIHKDLWDRILSSAMKPEPKQPPIKKVYIPILRGLRKLDVKKDLYKERTLIDYFDNMNSEALSIYTGQSFNDDIKNANPQTLKKFQLFLSKHFFNQEKVSIIPSTSKDTDTRLPLSPTVKIGSSVERLVSDLGDGIQSLICILAKPFLTKEPTIFFIEEPETYLHPGWQKDLVQAFIACEQHCFFLNSHSNHLLASALESKKVSLFHVIKDFQEPDSEAVITSLSTSVEILQDLRVRATSALLANCSIWVEGVTDKLYIKALLRQLVAYLASKNKHDESRILNELKEGLHYAFVEYQGSNIVHWDFDGSKADDEKRSLAAALSQSIFLIADGDIVSRSNNGQNRVDWLRSALNENFFLFPFKEIENGLPVPAIKDAASKRIESAKYKTSDTKFRTNEIESCKLKQCDGIGAYLECFVDKPMARSDNEESHKYFTTSSRTISNKVNFCDDVVLFMDNYLKPNDEPRSKATLLDKDSLELCIRLFNFMMNSNDLPYTLNGSDPELTL